MAYTTINKSTDYFNTKLYTGTGSSQAITGVGFQPDFTWIKKRSGAENHALFDAVRGVTKYVKSDETASEVTEASSLSAFGTDGFTVVSSGKTNTNSATYVSWNWKAGTTSGITTTGADITPSSYSMNATSGISIIKFTGNGVDGAKIAHGLGAVPELIMSKRLENSNYWAVYHKLDVTDYLVLNTTAAYSDAPLWKDTAPTSVYYQTDNSNSVNPNGETVVAYCFKSVPGYSKIGSYTGNGNADGTFVYTGFKPAFVIVKKSSGTSNWTMWDTARQTNEINKPLYSDTSAAESAQSTVKLDLLSNGFKIRGNGSNINSSGGSYIYMSFAEAPLVGSNNVPCTAR